MEPGVLPGRGRALAVRDRLEWPGARAGGFGIAILFPLFFFVAFAVGLSRVGEVPGFDFPSGYVPVDLLAGWVQTVASVNPVTPLMEAARAFVSGDADVVLAVAVGLALVVMFALWALRGLRRAEASGS